MGVDEHAVIAAGEALCEWMGRHGHDRPAAWLRARLDVIASEQLVPDRVRRAVQDIHEALPGMGGLGDLPPRGETSEERIAARTELDHLVEHLYEVTNTS